LWRHRALHRLTRDHTLVDALVRNGAISAAEAKRHRWRHVISNALGGGHRQVEVEVHKLQIEAGDVILLCSDGLTEMVSDENISQILSAGNDPEKTCRQLVERANEAGGRDNITVIVAQFENESAAPA